MFEQALLSETDKRPWSLGASITLQCAIVGSMMLYSVLHVELLPLIAMRHLPIPMPQFPKVLSSVKLVPVPAQPRPAGKLSLPHPFTQPSRIPTSIPKFDDTAAEAPVLSSTLGTAALPNGVVGIPGAIIIPDHVPAPPPAPPVASVQAVKPATPPIRVSLGVMEAKILKRVLPIYPQLAKNARISGKVHLTAIIAKNGTIQKLELIDGHPLLVASAIAAVRQWVYRPTTLNGEPVDVISPIEVNFLLTQ